MTDPADTIERTLGDHLGSGSRWENETWTQACTCGWATTGHARTTDATQARRAHIAAEIEKALGLHPDDQPAVGDPAEQWDADWAADQPTCDTRESVPPHFSCTRPRRHVGHHAASDGDEVLAAWPQEATQAARSGPNEADGHAGAGEVY